MYLDEMKQMNKSCEVRAVKERMFSAEIEQLKHDEDFNIPPNKVKQIRE